MCHKCDEFFRCGTELLDGLLRIRSAQPNCFPVHSTMATTRTIMESLEDATMTESYSEVCLALAVAVERLVALDQCGL
jgi:hypothetical protein